jgi:membrane peptidoglycan carboxypeptidase
MEQTPYIQPQPKESFWRKKPGAVIVILIVIVALSISAAAVFGRHAQPSVKAISLYYNDGKTLLWKTGQDKGNKVSFIDYVTEQLKAKYGADYANQGEWRVTTTLDNKLQKVAEDQVAQQTSALQKANIEKTAFVAEDPISGQVVSWLDNSIGEQQATVRSKTVVGTLQLPFTYAAFMDKTGKSTDTMLNDVQEKLPGYPCTSRNAPSQGGNCLYNFDQRYLGPVSVKQALAGGRLVPAVQAAVQTDGNNMIGATHVSDMMKKMGSDSGCYLDAKAATKTDCYVSSSFGDGVLATPLSMTQAFATLANNGAKTEQATILQVFLNGQVKQSWRLPQPTQTISQPIANGLTASLSDASLSYITHKELFDANGQPLAVVGGFNNDGTISSGVQYSAKYVAGFWASTSKAGTVAGSPVQQTVLPVTHGWLSQAQ